MVILKANTNFTYIILPSCNLYTHFRLFISMQTNKLSFLNSKSQPSGSNLERKKLCMFGKNEGVLNSTGEKFSPESPLLTAEPHQSENSLGNSQVNTEFTDFTALKLQKTLHWEILVLSFHCVCGPKHPFSSSYVLTEIIQGVLNIRQQHEGFIRTKKQLEVSRIKVNWYFGAQWTWKILNYHINKLLTVSKMAIILSWLLCAVKQQRPTICNLVSGPSTT